MSGSSMAALHIALPVLVESDWPKLCEVALNAVLGLPLQNHCNTGPSHMWGVNCHQKEVIVMLDKFLDDVLATDHIERYLVGNTLPVIVISKPLRLDWQWTPMSRGAHQDSRTTHLLVFRQQLCWIVPCLTAQ
eukprot:11744702-Ditylum_brightwellii.AAC.1